MEQTRDANGQFMKEKKVDWRIIMVGLVCLTAIQITCLIMGINGKVLAAVLMIIAGVCGWSAPQLKFK